jgi:hypothetical protein
LRLDSKLGQCVFESHAQSADPGEQINEPDHQVSP